MALNEPAERAAIHSSLHAQLTAMASNNPEDLALFQQVDNMLRSPDADLQHLGRQILANACGINPTALLHNQSAVNQIVEDAWGVRQGQTFSSLRGGGRRDSLVHSRLQAIINAARNRQDQINQLQTEAARSGQRSKVEGYLAVLDPQISARNKAVAQAVNDLLIAKDVSDPTQRTRLTAIGNQILRQVDASYTPGATSVDPVRDVIMSRVMRALPNETIDQLAQNDPAAQQKINSIIQETYALLHQARNSQRGQLEDTFTRWQKIRGADGGHLKGLSGAEFAGGPKLAKVEARKPTNIPEPKVVAPKGMPKTIEAMGPAAPVYVENNQYQDYQDRADAAKQRRAESRGPSLLDRMKNTFKLDENEHVEDKLNLAKWEKIIFPVAILHAIGHYGRRFIQWLTRNTLVKGASLLKKAAIFAAKNVAKLGPIARRGGWLIFSLMGLTIPSLIRLAFLDNGYRKGAWWGVKPYSVYRAEQKAKKRQQQQNQ